MPDSPEKQRATENPIQGPSGEPPVWVPLRDTLGRPIKDGDTSVWVKRSGKELAGVQHKVRLRADEIPITGSPKKDTARMTAQSNRGLPPEKQPVQKPSQPQSSVAHPKDPPPPATPLSPLTTPTPTAIGDVIGSILKDEASELAAIETIRSEAEARGIANRFGQGEPVTADEVRRAARGLVNAARKADDLIRPEVFSGLVSELSNALGSAFEREAKGFEIAAQRGEKIDKGLLDFAASEGLGLERQRQLFGIGGEGFPGMVLRLGEIKRSQLKKEINAARGKNNIGEVYAEYPGEAYTWNGSSRPTFRKRLCMGRDGGST